MIRTLALALVGLSLTACTTGGPERVALEAAPAFVVDAEEDGSGVVRAGDLAVDIPEGVLPWDCTTDGNGECGPREAWQPGVTDAQACTTLVVAGSPARRLVTDYALDYCTGAGVVAVRVATDVDVEGEVV